MRGTVYFRKGSWHVDLKANIGSLITNRVILGELVTFLERHYGRKQTGSVLDLGAGSKPYAPLYERYFSAITALDTHRSAHDTADIDVFASADRLPFRDRTFDCVICTEVLEHCRHPGKVMGELARVLKPGGRAFVTTPFLLPLHEMPHDYYRFTPSALAALAGEATLSVDSITSRGSYVAVVTSMLLMPVSRFWRRTASILRMPLLYHPYNPLVYLSIVFPQELYLVARRSQMGMRFSWARQLRDKVTHYSLGYVTQLEKPGRPQGKGAPRAGLAVDDANRDVRDTV